MQYKYVNEKTIEILCEEGLEEWFWTKMYEALVDGEVTLKKLQRSFSDEDQKKQSSYRVIRIKRNE